MGQNAVTTQHFRCAHLLALLALVLAGAAHTGAAAQSIDDERSACQTVNCQAVVVGGSINRHQWNLSGGSTATIPRQGAGSWVMPVRAGEGECLRLDILAQSTRMEIVVVSPSGVVWRNSARGGGACPECPLVKIDDTEQAGYYVVHVNHAGGGKVDGTFKLAYGRYKRPNPNCAPLTPPLE